MSRDGLFKALSADGKPTASKAVDSCRLHGGFALPNSAAYGPSAAHAAGNSAFAQVSGVPQLYYDI